jgi:hypothetical protein
LTEIRIVNEKTGAEKCSKPERMDLIPAEALEELGRVYGFGIKKYSAHNWRKGYDWSLSMSALLRHYMAFQRGEDVDPESGLHHLAHAMFHCAALIVFAEEHNELDDRWKP